MVKAQWRQMSSTRGTTLKPVWWFQTTWTIAQWFSICIWILQTFESQYQLEHLPCVKDSPRHLIILPRPGVRSPWRTEREDLAKTIANKIRCATQCETPRLASTKTFHNAWSLAARFSSPGAWGDVGPFGFLFPNAWRPECAIFFPFMVITPWGSQQHCFTWKTS